MKNNPQILILIMNVIDFAFLSINNKFKDYQFLNQKLILMCLNLLYYLQIIFKISKIFI
jgi:hypothetical protein